MFTGIVTAQGTVTRIELLDDARRMDVEADEGFLDDAGHGASIAIDGVCTTVVRRAGESFAVEAIGTTLSRTTVGEYEPGRPVNLELALAFGERLGGHLVQGHVDGVG
jgi:riboflavin synthase